MNTQILAACLALFGTMLLTWTDRSGNRYRRRIGKHLSHQNSTGKFLSLQTEFVKKLPNRELIQTKLLLIGSTLTLRQLRLQQLSYGAAGVVIGGVVLLRDFPALNPISLLLLPAISTVGWYFPMSNLNSKFNRLKDELNFGFPEVVDLIALSVTAGNSLSHALIQVSDLVPPPWRNQLIAIRLDLTSGLSVTSSLERAANVLQHSTFTKFVSSILLTLERGTPLAVQLRIQATEVAELLRRELQMKAGKKESAMLLPVVFLILPTIVITTLFPGILALGKLI